ncbi:WhiB family transcriptional regulator [Streptomyces antimycoticus]|nr:MULTISPECIES: WhiB family transcriptional regulator [Streptomyces]AQW55110.1 WhiB family transcriptional regulator [Streptomyces hygroscopicus]ASQ99076.1 WhiB family transcriptional regulator [Streptomyces sp. 11-1-2]QTI87633.1 WhiB family transcriptional regulator [Streptomyces sp. AgN23]RSS36071.1 WhiB family transcriptional regulator [Streptomyces sp. WAC05858]WJE01108.1 WhiB family transcriptional regulator [Streptomyces antimycoticus]
MAWWQKAECTHEDPELFFPVGVAGPAAQQQEARAKEVCHRCPVIQECLEYALETGMTHGVWGGVGEEERRALRRKVQRRERVGARRAR